MCRWDERYCTCTVFSSTTKPLQQRISILQGAVHRTSVLFTELCCLLASTINQNTAKLTQQNYSLMLSWGTDNREICSVITQPLHRQLHTVNFMQITKKRQAKAKRHTTENKLCVWRHNMPPLLPRGRHRASRAAELTQRSTFQRRIRSHADCCSRLAR